MKLFTFRDMRRYDLNATDGLVGFVREFFFDDAQWEVRYIVADTGSWLIGRHVLISPYLVGHIDTEDASLELALTRRQVEGSPPVSADKPVSRRMEQDLAAYFQWPAYWIGDMAGGGAPPITAAGLDEDDEQGDEPGESGDPNLRSGREVIGYRIEAEDGDIGRVHDFIVDVESWRIVQMIIDTRAWLPGRKVLIAPRMISDIRWSDRRVRIDMPREVIERSPEYDSSQPFNDAYLKRLTDYYNRPADLP
jgi:hypothetical protein